MATELRRVGRGDAAELAALLSENRDYFERWIPARPDDYFTADGQRTQIDAALRAYQEGTALPCVMVEGSRIVGRIALTTIQRDGLFSATLGYSVARTSAGRGHASAAVAQMCDLAFGDLGLHRVEAGTVVTNLASQRVLERNGFARLCMAPSYVLVAGRWRDAALFQKLGDDSRMPR